MSAHVDNAPGSSSKDVDALIARIPKFSGALNAGESGDARRDQFVRWRNGVVKVLNLKGYGELVPAVDLAEVIGATGDTTEPVDVAEEKLDGDEAGTSVVATRTESEAARKARLVKLESPALAIISLSLYRLLFLIGLM